MGSGMEAIQPDTRRRAVRVEGAGRVHALNNAAVAAHGANR